VRRSQEAEKSRIQGGVNSRLLDFLNSWLLEFGDRTLFHCLSIASFDVNDVKFAFGILPDPQEKRSTPLIGA
jgi:hypothetical protein